jgi:hypothetical protein
MGGDEAFTSDSWEKKRSMIVMRFFLMNESSAKPLK